MEIISNFYDAKELIKNIGTKKVVSFTSHSLTKKDVVFHEGHRKMINWLKEQFDVVLLQIMVGKKNSPGKLIDTINEDITFDIPSFDINPDYIYINNIERDYFNNLVAKINPKLSNIDIVEGKADQDILTSIRALEFLYPIMDNLIWAKSLKGIIHFKNCLSHRTQYQNIDNSVKLIPNSIYTPLFRDQDGLLYSRNNPFSLHQYRITLRDVLNTIDFESDKPRNILLKLEQILVPNGYRAGYNIFDLEDINNNVRENLHVPNKTMVFCEARTDPKNGKLNTWQDYRFYGIDETKSYKEDWSEYVS